jgi:AraC family transcriptional activator of pobA
MISKNEIPLHILKNRDFYADYAKNINLGEASSSHRIDFFAVIWYKAEGPDQFIDFEPYPVNNNLIYLLSKDQVHYLPVPAPNAQVIIFSYSFFDRLEEELRLPFLPFNNKGIAVTEDIEPVLQSLFKLMVTENKADNESSLLQNYMYAYLTHINRLSHRNGPRSYFYDSRLKKLFTLINHNFRSEKFAAFYADQLGLTAKRINQIVQNELGYTLSQLITIYNLVEAKREISQNLKSFKEIAIELGFNSQSYFSRFFKKHTGQSPEEFRDTLL